MNKNITLIYGDCSSPEIVTQAVRVLDKIAARHGHTFTYTRAYMGGEAIIGSRAECIFRLRMII